MTEMKKTDSIAPLYCDLALKRGNCSRQDILSADGCVLEPEALSIFFQKYICALSNISFLKLFL
jgi:hypothetical protein